MIKPPIFIIDPSDIVAFQTVEDAARYAEPWYDEYAVKIFDSNGQKLRVIGPQESQRIAEYEPPQISPGELLYNLKNFFQATGSMIDRDDLQSAVRYFIEYRMFHT